MEERSTSGDAAIKKPRESHHRKIQKRRLHEFPSSFWAGSTEKLGEEVSNNIHEVEELNSENASLPNISLVEISSHSTCNTCGSTFDSHIELRDHCQTDRHRLNLKRKLKSKPPLSEQDFEQVCDNLSDGSLSGSGEEDSDDEDNDRMESTRKKAKPVIKLQFNDPCEDGSFLIVYKVALPDQLSLRSFERLGPWAVIMTGGGHFSAAVWDESGNMLKHKSFHRYTTRRKQGGAQSLADAGGSRIKSAGATLRRYGEQALRQDVQELLLNWTTELENVQSLFIRSSKRDKRDLLFGWEESPLLGCKDRGVICNVPFPTRRATLKEVSRVYEQLSTVIMSPISLIAAEVPEEAPEAKPKLKPKGNPQKPPRVPAVKGTAHLKKRESEPASSETGAEKVDLDDDYVQLIADIAGNKLPETQARLTESPQLKFAEYGVEYFKTHERLKSITHGLGLVCIAAGCGSLDVLEWLMLEKVPLQVGCSPYMVTKTKRVRTFLRKFWAQHPDLHDYAAAGIPAPLSEADVAASAEKERQKRKRERDKKSEKKNEKSFLASEATKPAHIRARELRAAAAEARVAGLQARPLVNSNMCTVCKKSLEGIVPFERLTFKYCSMDHVQKHRKVLGR